MRARFPSNVQIVSHHFCVVLWLISISTGCGDGRPALYPVHGTIAYRDGQPVRQASVEFIPESPGPSPRGKTDTEGKFKLGTYENADGAPAGDYRVVVIQVLPPRGAEHVRKLGEEHAAHGGRIDVVSLKHASPETSELSCTVEAKEQNDVKFVVDFR
ncbi:MAG: carboxypeptidase-like regulatory domain-containing protein [Lacipirellulaceae bacterium]